MIGKEEKIKEQIKKIGYNENFDIEIVNSKDTSKREKIANIAYNDFHKYTWSFRTKNLLN